MQDDPGLKLIWKQKNIPVVLRRTGKGEKLRVRIPFAENNRRWLQNYRRTSVVWKSDGEYWEIPKSWFDDFVNRALERYGKIYIIQPFRPHEKCAPACLNATGHECNCSCMGANHGAGNDGSWFEVSDAFAIKWGNPMLACRLLTQKSAKI
jgi:hypothetical protein